jgi:hypothetical protein
MVERIFGSCVLPTAVSEEDGIAGKGAMASEPVILNVYDMVSICVVLDGWSHILF